MKIIKFLIVVLENINLEWNSWNQIFLIFRFFRFRFDFSDFFWFFWFRFDFSDFFGLKSVGFKLGKSRGKSKKSRKKIKTKNQKNRKNQKIKKIKKLRFQLFPPWIYAIIQWSFFSTTTIALLYSVGSQCIDIKSKKNDFQPCNFLSISHSILHRWIISYLFTICALTTDTLCVRTEPRKKYRTSQNGYRFSAFSAKIKV